MRSVIVIGGGISGLAAAWQLRGHADVTVLESHTGVGGKLRTATIAGIAVDEGAESLMALRPEAVELAAAVGLGDALCDPAKAPTTIWTHGGLRPLPPGHVMGLPADPAALAGAGLLSPEGAARAAAEEGLPAAPLTQDCSVGHYLAARFGREAVDRLVEPLLGGVYAGRADLLSLRAAMPRIAAVAEQGGPVLPALRRMRAAGAPRSAPVAVQGVVGGTGRFPGGRRVLRGPHPDGDDGPLPGPSPRRPLAGLGDDGRRPAGDGGGRGGPGRTGVRGGAVAAPARTARRGGAGGGPPRLDGGHHHGLLPRPVPLPPGGERLPGPAGRRPPAEGGLVPLQQVAVAARFGPRHVRPARLGGPDRRGIPPEPPGPPPGPRGDRRTPPGGGPDGEPLATRVTRWNRGLPQYCVGHHERVARIRGAASKLPGLALCGAAYEGVGVAACVATARKAAHHLLTHP
ncbi:protoporphyrinogen oxidase [Streptomyces roseus]|uniref:protoporphyrinogen oxidase n=1 Tax=Streptomyces roseus TaxID=66430 RepID=UPI00367F95CE